MAEAAPAAVSGPLGDLRIGLAGGAWRMAPAWAVVAGAISNGFQSNDLGSWLLLIAAVVLADLAWGAIWALPLGAGEGGHSGRHGRLLPYLQVGSPASRIWQSIPADLWPGVLSGAVISLALSALLGPPIVLLSLVVMGLALWTIWATRSGVEPALARAWLSIGLPWLLGAVVAGATALDAVTFGQGGERLLGPFVPEACALGLAFVTLEWGLGRVWRVPSSRGRGVWLGLASLLAVLLALRLQLAVLVVVSLALPAILAILRGRGSFNPITGRAHVLGFAAPWWWAILIVAACALRWRVF